MDILLTQMVGVEVAENFLNKYPDVNTIFTNGDQEGCQQTKSVTERDRQMIKTRRR
jgi:hypothetical protein|tara:strand:- start:249 stop:416 length:168 start_codon:yes stop_codon:yes gene_type:complete